MYIYMYVYIYIYIERETQVFVKATPHSSQCEKKHDLQIMFSFNHCVTILQPLMF